MMRSAAAYAALTAIADQFEKAMPAEPPAEGETVVQFPAPEGGLSAPQSG